MLTAKNDATMNVRSQSIITKNVLIARLAIDSRLKRVLVLGDSPFQLANRMRSSGIEAFGLTPRDAGLRDHSSPTGAFGQIVPQAVGLVVWQLCLTDGIPADGEAIIASLGITRAVVLILAEGRVATIQEYPKELAQLFARHGYFRDPDYLLEDAGTQVFCFRHFPEPLERLILFYDQRLWEREQEVHIRRCLGIAGISEVTTLGLRWYQLKRRIVRDIRQRLVRLFHELIPSVSQREKVVHAGTQSWKVLRERGFHELVEVGWRMLVRQAELMLAQIRHRFSTISQGQLATIEPVRQRRSFPLHRGSVDIIICVHNALEDIRSCLQSVSEHTNSPYNLILVDDGSGPETAGFLAQFAERNDAFLIRNDEARGYTLAANQGLRRATGDYVVLLNSDTMVTKGWLDGLLDCAQSDARIGIVGPLSNTASWQSIPDVLNGGDWATNPLPEGMTIEDVGRMVSHYSASLYPEMPFLNGFCMLIRRRLMDEIGIFDEENFDRGFGEENDYALRARKAGWVLALADNAYVHHAQSKSYSSERRKELSELAARTLEKKHDLGTIHRGVIYCRSDRVLVGIRSRARAMMERQRLIRIGQELHQGRRLLFLLPICDPCGGSNVVITEALAMRKMGVDAAIFNLSAHKTSFDKGYPDLELPLIYGDKDELHQIVTRFDGVIATHCSSVGWMDSLREVHPAVQCGYYIQDFEPYFYPIDSPDYRDAWESYTKFEDVRLFTKTEWNRQEVLALTGANPHVVGASLNVDLFRPRPRRGEEWPDRPLRIAAMIRPETPRRQPDKTMLLLRKASRKFGGRVTLHIFGTSPYHPNFSQLVRDFPWTLYGTLTPYQVASFMNEMDIFVDFSKYQAMGLTALEAMACGCAVIVPQKGGSVSFARHEHNGLVVDTSDVEAVWKALERLVTDSKLRSQLQANAITDVCHHSPEAAALNILHVMFRVGPSQ